MASAKVTRPGVHRRGHAGPLMAVECPKVKVPFVVKGEKTERGPGDTYRLAVPKLYDDLGHAHPSPGEARQTVAANFLLS